MKRTFARSGDDYWMDGRQVPLEHQMLSKLLVDKIVCAPKRDDEPHYELRATFAFGAVFSGVIGVPVALVAVRAYNNSPRSKNCASQPYDSP
jgi:hypothetical protein